MSRDTDAADDPAPGVPGARGEVSAGDGIGIGACTGIDTGVGIGAGADARRGTGADACPGTETEGGAGPRNDGRAGTGAVELVAVDGGASRCRLAAFDARGRRLAETSVDGHASLTLGEADAWGNVRLGIERLAASLGDPEAPRWLPPRLALGLAGALQDERHARFLALVEAATGGATACRVVTDGHAQLLGASGGAPGVCLAVGTGSVVHWLDRHGASGIAGGWGFPAGDEGSGAWLGLRLLQRYLWHLDGETCASPLMGDVAARVGDAASAIQRWSTDARSTAHATLAPLVVAGAARGDALACSLLDEGAFHCLRLIAQAPPALPVHVAGGLGTAYASRLEARLGDRLRAPRGDALDGLRTLAPSDGRASS